MTEGPSRVPHRSLLREAGVSNESIRNPQTEVANSWNGIVPDHVHLDTLARTRLLGACPKNNFEPDFTASESIIALISLICRQEKYFSDRLLG